MEAPTPPADARRRALARLAGADRMAIFVPAVMGMGLLFWFLSALRDVARSQRERSRAKRCAIAAHAVADRLQTADAVRTPHRRGLHDRPVYLVAAATLIGAGCYVAIGSVANYRRTDGYLSDIAWLLALSLAVAALCAGAGMAALATFLTYPDPPGWVRPILARSFLSTDPGNDRSARPSWQVSAAVLGAWAAFATLSLVVTASPHVVVGLDGDLAGLARRHRLPGPGTWLDALGHPAVPLVVLALAVALVARRCRVHLVALLGAAMAGRGLGAVVRSLAARPRPPGEWAGRLDSYPAGQVVLLTLAAGLVAAALADGVGRRWVGGLLDAILAAVVAAVAYDQVAGARSWPSDVVGGLLLAGALVATAEWLLQVRRLHQHCPPRCRHRPATAGTAPRPVERLLGAIPLRPRAAGVIRTAAHVAASLAALTLVVLSFTRGIPTNPEGPELGLLLERPAQLGLAALVSVAALVGWRRPAIGAVVLAVAATGLGIFAGVEYEPAWAVALTIGLMIPAVLLWLSWQHRRRPTEIVVLATVTTMLVTGTWVGAATVYAGFYGPTHPASTTPGVAVDRIDWLWTGALTSRSVTVVAHLAGRGGQAVAVATDTRTGAVVRSPAAAPDPYRLVRLGVDGLEPDHDYRFGIEVDGVADRGRGRGRFATPGEGPFSFRLAVASCARTGSNGTVFDAIAATDPLLYLEIGDLHYQNLEATTAGPFVDAFGRALTQPAQAALARQVPMAYVWDDHDYGPNDAGAASPTRPAAQQAYRAAVPHAALPAADGAIYQAFTVGRVRIVITDGRSERTEGQILGADQERWLVDELRRSAATHALVVWANGTPWIGPERPGADTWAGAAEQRARIAGAVAEAGITNLVMVAGDAHMVAIDDGTDNRYAGGDTPGFPVLQAAALDRPGSLKGGPYSEGAFPGGGQFGLLDIVDHGDAVDVRLAGMRWDGTTLVSLERRFTTG